MFLRQEDKFANLTLMLNAMIFGHQSVTLGGLELCRLVLPRK